MKKIFNNIFGIAALIILLFVVVSKIPFLITDTDIGYSLGLIAEKILGVKKIFTLIFLLQIILVILLVIMFSKIGSKVISILSIFISFLFINVIIFINISNNINYKNGFGIWLCLLSFILLSINYFVNIFKIINVEKNIPVRRESIKMRNKKESSFNDIFKNKYLIVSIVCIMISIISIYFAINKESNSFNNGKANVKDNESSSENNKGNLSNAIKVNIGQNIENENKYVISFLNSKFTTKIEPTNPDDYYSYYETKDKENNIYFVLMTTIKNLGTETLKGEKLPSAVLIFDGKYRYDMLSIFEEDDGSDLEEYDWYKDIDPLKTKKIWYIVEVPNEVDNSTDKSLTVEYKINDIVYNVVVR